MTRQRLRLLRPQEELRATLTEWFEDSAEPDARSVCVRVRLDPDWGLSTVLDEFSAEIEDRAVVVRIDGRLDRRDQSQRFVEDVEAALVSSERRAASKIAEVVGAASGPGLLGWALLGIGTAVPMGLAAAVLSQMLQEPVGKALETMGRSIGSSPIGRAAGRLAVCSRETPVVVIVDHTEHVDDSLAEPLARLVGRSGSQLLLVVAEQAPSAFLQQLGTSVRIQSAGHQPELYVESVPRLHALEVAIEELGALSDSDAQAVDRACQTVASAGRLVNSTALGLQPQTGRSLSGLDLPAIAARRDGVRAPASVVLAVALGGSIDAEVFRVACAAAGVEFDAEDESRSTTWWTSESVGRFTVRADRRGRVRSQIAYTFGETSLQLVATKVLEFVGPTIMTPPQEGSSTAALRLAEVICALKDQLGPCAELARASTIVLNWRRQFGTSKQDLASALRVIETCESAAVNAPALDELRASVMLAEGDPSNEEIHSVCLRVLALPDAGPERLAVKVAAAARQLASGGPTERTAARNYLRTLGRRIIDADQHILNANERSALLAQCALTLATDSPMVASELIAACQPTDSALVEQLVDNARARLGGRVELLSLVERAVAAVESEDHLVAEFRLESRCTLVGLLLSLDAFQQLVDHCPVLIDLSERVLGRQHEVTLCARFTYAHALETTGRFVEAVTVAEALAEDVPTDLYGVRFKALGLLALLYDCLGRPALALQRGNEALEVGIGNPKIDPISLASLRTTISGSLAALGRYEEAIEHARAAHTALHDRFGSFDATTLNALQQVGRVLVHQGRMKEAIETGQQVVEGRAQTLGSDHLLTLVARYQVSNAMVGDQQFENGVDVIAELLDEMSRHRDLGPDHPSTLAAQHLLAECYLGAGRAEEAQEVATTLHERRCKHAQVGPSHPNTISTEMLLAEIESRRPDLVSALEWSISALRKSHKSPALGSSHPQTAIVETRAERHATRARHLGVEARTDGRFSAAESLLQAAAKFGEALVAEAPSPYRIGELAASRLEYGILMHDHGQRPEAIKEISRASELFDLASVQDPDEPQHRLNRDNARAWLSHYSEVAGDN